MQLNKKSKSTHYFWSSIYAKKYILKNSRFNWAKGDKAWRIMLSKAKNIKSILECGSNIGRNIKMLNGVLPAAEKSIIEISEPAFKIATKKYKLVHASNCAIEDSKIPNKFDLVFTMGVLIHVRNKDLKKVVSKMFNYSKKYILIGEYFNRTPIMLKYQGLDNKLFKRDFGKFIMSKFSVELVDNGFLWSHLFEDAGFDDITWWLFRKKPFKNKKH